MALEWQAWVFAHFEEDVVGRHLDLGVVLVVLLDRIDKAGPKLCVRGSFREARDHIEACVNAHLVRFEMELRDRRMKGG